MCLILFAYQPNNQHRLIVAANRDEFYGRPSDSAKFWETTPQMLAGRDLEAGGTWLGVDRQGRFAAVTNFRLSAADLTKTRSRGDLAHRFLAQNLSAREYYQLISPNLGDYRGFNLLLMDDSGLFYGSNERQDLLRLEPGVYGLSNQRLDCDWPKVVEGKAKLAVMAGQTDLGAEPLLELLLDAGDGRPFSNSFIQSDDYGTCVSTAVLIEHQGKVSFSEQSFHPGGLSGDLSTFNF